MRFLKDCLLFFLVLTPALCDANSSVETEVCVFGATPGGIAAALAAGSEGKRVLLVESASRIGGMMTNGLSHSDFHSFESLTGAYLEHTQRVIEYYDKEYGENSPQAREHFRGTHAEPKVNQLVFERMIAEYPSIKVVRNWRLESVERQDDRIERAVFNSNDGRQSVAASVFIDGTYEGDLIAAAGVEYRVGREGRAEFGESLAPEKADDQLQAYNFRFCATKDPDNRVAVQAPEGYDREEFLDLIPILESGAIDNVFGNPRRFIYKAQTPTLPNGKFDINDVSNGIVRLSLPGDNLGWPEGSYEERERIFQIHVRHNVGMLYFLQNDSAVPQKFRDQALEWGWCKDEFVDTNHLPEQLYVREARRMRGVHVYTQRDSEFAGDDARAVLHTDSIAMGDYGNNCHGTYHEGPRIGGRHTGEFYNPIPPYQIPYGVLLPKDVENLLAPVPASSSHVGFCALRLEPIWMSLGQAAGHAAAMAVEANTSVQAVSVPELQASLHRRGSATIYFADALPGHPDFEAVQWWGTLGGFHGVNKTTGKARGERILGQYYEAAPKHEAELNKALDADLRARWLELAKELGISLPGASKMETRGEFIRAAYASKG